MDDFKDLTREAIRKYGGAAKVAEDEGISWQAVYGWPRIPAERVARIAKGAGMKPHEIRPDIFPSEVVT